MKAAFLGLLFAASCGLALAQDKAPPVPKEGQERIKEFQRHANSEEP